MNPLKALIGPRAAAKLANVSARELSLCDVTALRALGLSEAHAERLQAALELGRAALESPLTGELDRIGSSRDVYAYLRPRYAAAEVEFMLAIPLDAKNRPMLPEPIVVAQGGVHSCPVAPTDVFRPLIRLGAVGVILAHNHPSGEPSPSAEDTALTDRLKRASELLGVRLLDHVIVAREGYFSFLDSGIL